jgi:hypothetical protein
MASDQLNSVVQELLGKELEAIALEEAYPPFPSNAALARAVVDHSDPQMKAPELVRLAAIAHLIYLFDCNDDPDRVMHQT